MADSTKKVIIDVKAHTKGATDEIKKLNSQIKSLEKQQTRSNKTMRKTTSTVNKIAGSFKQLSAHLARLVVIYGSFEALSSTVTVIKDFEQSIANLGAISGASGEELDALRAKAMDLGKSTIFTATQVADAMTEMARAGLDSQQQLDGIKGVLDLAITGLVDLKDSAIITTTVLHSFGMESKDIPTIVDVLTASINSSAQNLEQLSNALRKVAPVAHAQNISLQETTAVLGVMADAGIRAERAGTQLKIAIERISSNTNAKKFIKELGISMYDLQTKELLPLTKRLSLLKTALSSLTKEQQASYKAKIFGSEALATATVLLNKITKIKLQTEFLNNSFGVADAQARKMMDTLQGSFKELFSALENLQIVMGKSLSPTLKNLVQDATEFIRTLSPKDINNFGNAIGNVIEVTYDLGKTLLQVAEAGVKVGEFFSPDGKLTGGFILTTAIILKFRKALLALLTTQPEILALIMSLGLLLERLFKADAEIDSMNKNADKYLTQILSMVKVNEEVTKSWDDMSLADVRKDLSKVNDTIEQSQRFLKRLKSQIDELKKKEKDSWFGLDDLDAEKLRQLEQQYNGLNSSIISGMKLRNNLQKKGQVLLDAENASRTANNQLTTKAHLLSQQEQNDLQKLITSYKQREVTAQNTLNSLIAKETSYYNKLKNLEADLANTRKKFADKRAILNANFENDIANIRASGFSKLEQYNNAQMRADKALSSAKRALINGDLTLAKNYMTIYKSLITQQTSSEIKNGKLVVKTKKELNNELIRDKQAGHKIELAILKEEETRAIALINNQIDLEKNKIRLNKAQMDIQLKILEIQAKSVKLLSTNITWDEDLKKAKDELNRLTADALKLTEKQRSIKIKTIIDKNKLAKDIDDGGKKSVITPDADTQPATTKVKKDVEKVKPEINITFTDYGINEFEKKFGKVKANAEKPIFSNYEVDVSKADSSITKVQNKAKKPTNSLHTIKVNDSAVIRAIQFNSRNTHSIHTIYVKTVHKHATGGFIKREGALGGYGGGDKIESLLEAGEFIVRKEAVAKLGLDKLYQINNGIIPKFATGGFVGDSNSTTKGTVNLNLNVGGKTFTTIADEDIAKSLSSYLQRTEF